MVLSLLNTEHRPFSSSWSICVSCWVGELPFNSLVSSFCASTLVLLPVARRLTRNGFICSLLLSTCDSCFGLSMWFSWTLNFGIIGESSPSSHFFIWKSSRSSCSLLNGLGYTLPDPLGCLNYRSLGIWWKYLWEDFYSKAIIEFSKPGLSKV